MIQEQRKSKEEAANQDERACTVAKLRILFVDSDSYACAKTKKSLEPTFDVQCVSSLVEAKQHLDEEPPDMLILEMVVGKESSLSLCNYVRASERMRRLPIMFLTSMSTIYDKVAGFEAGADDYVVKPFEPYHLIARVRLLARIKRLEPRISS